MLFRSKRKVERAQAKARKATKKLAFDLVDVYARRASVQGYRFGPDTAAQREMEEAFPYQETPDQLAAIANVKADMQSAKPMDRLVCGDVGFGKTEVALRAAFKATQDSKQVMVLCPTTILAQQHYTNFKERCEPFGVRVEVLSRFRTPAQQAAALKGFQEVVDGPVMKEGYECALSASQIQAVVPVGTKPLADAVSPDLLRRKIQDFLHMLIDRAASAVGIGDDPFSGAFRSRSFFMRANVSAHSSLFRADIGRLPFTALP